MRANIARVKDCEREIETMKLRLTEIAQEKEAVRAEKKAKKAKVKASPAPETFKPVDENQEAAPRSDIMPVVVEGAPEHEQTEEAEILKAVMAGQEDTGSHASAKA
jgi:hypothetical protein